MAAPKPPILHADLQEVALIDALTCAAVGGMSVSWWHEEVRTGRAPQPVIRQPRCTRWRVGEVRAFWETRAQVDPAAASRLMTTASKASRAAQRAKQSRKG